MNWSEIPGHQEIKSRLQEGLQEGRIAHAQLLVGATGYGSLALALAYARAVLCGDDPKQNKQMDHFQHPDMHFSYPIVLDSKRKIEKSSDVIELWRSYLPNNLFGQRADWLKHLGAENKQLIIGKDEAEDILRKFSLKSYQGGYKVLVIWLAESMNHSAANKLLKLIEEPPENSLILLVAEDESAILPTIRSRCQTVHVPPYSYEELAEYLSQKTALTEAETRVITVRSGGDLGKASKLADGQEETDMEAFFVQWIRNAFMAKKKPQVLQDLVSWSQELHSWGREGQIAFLRYAQEIFRLALLQNYGCAGLVYRPIQDEGFSWDSFCAYIHGGNIDDIREATDRAIMEIGRNVNAKAVLLDMSIEVTRYLHRSA